jgi:hypothetical protein
MRFVRCPCAALLLAALTEFMLAAPADAGDPLGTTGPFRSSSWENCEAGAAQQFRGACDPPAVDPSLPMAKQSAAHVERALKLIALGRFPQAREGLDAAVSADPRNVSALNCAPAL